jgi:uncharacterized protein YpmB
LIVDESTHHGTPSGATQPAHMTHAAKRQANKRKKLIIIGAIAAGLLMVLAAVWFFVLRNASPAKPAQTTAKSQANKPVESLPNPQTSATPATFKSTPLNIEITHRQDWTRKEDKQTGEITLTSPRISYSRLDDTAGSGVFTLKIRKGITEPMQAAIEKAVAVRDSEVIAYANPTESQRYYTNVSYAGQEEAFNFFIVTSSTALKAGNPFAYMLVLNDETYLIAGGYGTDKDGALSFDAVPKTAIDSEAMTQAIDIVESIRIF